MSYPGGKSGSGVYQFIINQMPAHRVYIEPFLGGGAILRLKRPASSSIGVDSDGDVVASWRAMAVPGATVICDDAFRMLRAYPFQGDELVYCDPPYLMETRSCQRALYRHEFTRDQHRELLELIDGLPCMVMISGYWSELYAAALSTWRSVSFRARTRGGRMATEWLWMNFPPPLELHDYRYLGQTFRERERIQRKRKRWTARLRCMPALERYAILSAIADLKVDRTSPVPAGPAGPSKSGDGGRLIIAP